MKEDDVLQTARRGRIFPIDPTLTYLNRRAVFLQDDAALITTTAERIGAKAEICVTGEQLRADGEGEE